ncbi:GNAT family N-acetyltransferase [Rhodovastum atsumiense]|uniref:GNAT family N-acetyltransferase n=1 Tax=Rhodovastum atsumiense TaxID=504468 RepID=A0A5M6IZY4_9PROT|nr:GNAT family N-acetyltransferase [Rhodovastum atsumiense]KAA5613387.1 GNAT family N-acetyltransferase [Rhodovastum atsumiense]CAH2603074.1 GNAT family N-acetyltransferase [Rhodovastum atsumiense]
MPTLQESPVFPTLATDRLALRALGPDDLDAYHALMQLPETTRFSNWPDSPGRDHMEGYIKRRIENFASGQGCSWAIDDRPSGRFIGCIRFNYFIKDWKCGEVGYELHPDFWNRGLMTEALRAIVACGHTVFGLHRIDAWTLPGNPASDHVLQKAGFRYEGTLRGRGWWKGSFHDFRIFGRIVGDPAR